MSTFIASLHAFALKIGGVGLAGVAFLDSSFLSLPQVNDLLVVLLVVSRKPLMPYYAAMATLGSIGGCYVLYRLADRGGEAFLRRRVSLSRVEPVLAAYRKHGVLALMVPALLPPPAPFKLFVLLAGVAGVRPGKFVLAICVARGARYLIIGTLAVLYGDQALELMRTHGREVALGLIGTILSIALVVWAVQRRRTHARAG
ncbi:MAG: hypothetical protein FJW23_15670 [Acidimicrobiia bacterium]|nr:hypothetical protein [Acidimicrobiia bacterium]